MSSAGKIERDARSLMELAVRIENAIGPDRELDCLIWGNIHHPNNNKKWRAIQITDGHSPYGFIAPGWTVMTHSEGSHHKINAIPAYTASLDKAMTLLPDGMQLAIYTNWVITNGYPCNENGGIEITDEMPRGCCVRTYGGDEKHKNVEGYGRSQALAISAIALRARAKLLPC